MFKSQITGSASALSIVLFTASIAMAVFYFSIIASFRMPLDFSGLAWQLHFDRSATVFAAGFALCISLASSPLEISPAKHIGIYAIIVLGSAGLVLGLVLAWPVPLCLILALAFAACSVFVMPKLNESSPENPLVLGIFLYFVFMVSVATYLAALVYTDGLGGFVRWLFLDISLVGVNGATALSLVFLLSIWLLLPRQRELPSLILLGLSVGLLGPIMFVGYLIPTWVQRLTLGRRAQLLVSGLIGGGALSLLSTSNYIMLGGYAPALIIPLGFISIPAVLWLCRSAQKISVPSISETILQLTIIVVSVAVAWHLAVYAHKLA